MLMILDALYGVYNGMSMGTSSDYMEVIKDGQLGNPKRNGGFTGRNHGKIIENSIGDSQQTMFDDTAGYHGIQTSRPFQGNDQYFMGTPCMINHFNISGYHGNQGIMGKRKGNVRHWNYLKL